jgi:hypothetical protein
LLIFNLLFIFYKPKKKNMVLNKLKKFYYFWVNQLTS